MDENFKFSVLMKNILWPNKFYDFVNTEKCPFFTLLVLVQLNFNIKFWKI